MSTHTNNEITQTQNQIVGFHTQKLERDLKKQYENTRKYNKIRNGNTVKFLLIEFRLLF